MDTINWGTVIVSAIAAGATVIAAILALRGKKGDAKLAIDARIDERQASELTRYFGLVEAQNARIDAMAKRISEQDAKIAELEKRHRTDSDTVSDMAEIQAEMVEHIEVLESLIPTPPGAPQRPDWLKNINGLGLA